MSQRGAHPGRSGLVILVVLVVVTLSAMVGSSILLSSDLAAVSSAHDRRSEQSRLAAWSGVQAVMSRLHAQRDELLDGVSPVIPASWTFPIDEGPTPAFRVSGGDRLLLAQSENAKLDVNLATPEMLAALPMIDERLAGSIVGARPFGSVAELIRVDGVTPELLYGAASTELGEFADGASQTTLSDVLTAFSFDPNVQLGVGEDGEAHRGNRRVNLGLEWSDSVRDAVIDRWDESVASFLEQLFEQGESLGKTSDLVALMDRLGASPDDWVEALDAVTTVDSEHVRGLVDLNRASAEVLGAIPGIDEASARAIVDARERIGLDQRRSIAWPVVEGVLSEESFAQACDWLTTRSMQWRLRVEGGTRAEPEGGGFDEGPALRDRVVYECVFDVSSRRPRVAYMRDVTGLELALAMRETADDDSIFAEEPALIDDESGEFDPDPIAETSERDRSTDADTGSPESEDDETNADSPPGGRIGRWAVGDGGGG